MGITSNRRYIPASAHQCPTCGCIRHIDLKLGKISRRIFNCIRRNPGCTVEDIIDWVYADRPVPATARESIGVLIQRLKGTLSVHGITIISRPGPNAPYTLVPLEPSVPSNGIV